jgi:hypothetical protein
MITLVFMRFGAFQKDIIVANSCQARLYDRSGIAAALLSLIDRVETEKMPAPGAGN